MIEAGVARNFEQPRLENVDALQPIDCQHHLDEGRLRYVFPFAVIAEHRAHEAADATLVEFDERAHGRLVSGARLLDCGGEVRRGLAAHRKVKGAVAHPVVRGSSRFAYEFA